MIWQIALFIAVVFVPMVFFTHCDLYRDKRRLELRIQPQMWVWEELKKNRAREEQERVKDAAFTKALQNNRVNLPSWLEWIR